MDFHSDRHDLIEIVDFIDRLLNELVDKVPEQKPQYRRVWRSDIRPKILDLKETLLRIKRPAGDTWGNLDNVGLTGEQLRFKHDGLELAAEKRSLPKVLKLVETLLGSLGKVFPYIEPVLEFTGFIQQSYESLSGVTFQTLFPPGEPIPSTDATSPESKGKKP